jgi:hypothetical protein
LNARPGNSGRSRLLEGAALLLLAVSAILFQRSATASVGGAADGHHLQVSPIDGIADFGLGTTGTAPTECRWWPKLGNEDLCAVAPDGAAWMAWLRRAYPLAVIALWTSVAALFLNALRIPRQAPAIGVAVTMLLPALAILALWSVASGAKRALVVLAGLTLEPVSGFLIMVAATVFTATAGLLLVVSRR